MNPAQPFAIGRPTAAASPASRSPQQTKEPPTNRPLAGCDDHEFLAQEQASWIAFLKDVMVGNCRDSEASPPGPGDP